MRDLLFERLPESAREIKDIAALWRKAGSEKESSADNAVVELTGAEASETAFKVQAPGKAVLHLATHGFFLQGGCPTASPHRRGVGGLTTAKPAATTSDSKNPLLLSGLVFAGANHRGDTAADEDDGILTAEEIAAIDLRGVEWAVLSACDTGIGQLQAGEGILGLRRAFSTAGAATVIMSLWSIEDRAARHWMRELYQARLRDKAGTGDAVHEATLRSLNFWRSNGQPHPFRWGSFVAAGDWR